LSSFIFKISSSLVCMEQLVFRGFMFSFVLWCEKLCSAACFVVEVFC
jgi:hypothetical protein